MKIVATGKKNKDDMTVTITKNQDGFSFLFNNEPDIALQLEIEDAIEAGVPIGGTYYPETKEFQIYSVISGGTFFDRGTAKIIEADGIKEEIPQPVGTKAIY